MGLPTNITIMPLTSLFLRCWLLILLSMGMAHAAAGSSAAPAAGWLDQPEETPFLEPDQAFGLHVEAIDARTLRADFSVAPGHYLYRERIHFKLPPAAKSRIGSVELPPGEAKHDANFGDSMVFHNDFSATIRLTHPDPRPERLTLLASYQGCSEKGLCYAPITKTFELSLTGAEGTAAPPAANETDRARSLLADGRLWLIALGFFGFGLLLSFTPCVFPMIPILSGIIVGQGQHPSRLHSFNLSLAYTLGMALAYTLAGVAAGLSGQLISNALQTPWALGFGAAVFVLLALSMFGFYELKLPVALETRMVAVSNRMKGGRFAGVFAMGVLSALIVSPCVAAPLAGALLYIGQTHDVVLGGVALFSLSIGMGVPLLVLGASAGALLPKAGAWMNAVRNLFGVIMLGMAVWLIGPVIPAPLQMGLYATLLIVSAIYLHALDGLPPNASGWRRLWKGLGIILLVYGIALLAGALAGNRQPLQPLAGLSWSGGEKSARHLPFQPVKNAAELDRSIAAAKGRFVMLDFYADWCVACKEYEEYTFTDPRVAKALKDVVLLKADVTQNSPDDLALLQRFGLYGPPGILFFDREGKQIKAIDTVGYQNAEQFLVTLNGLHASQGGECAATLAC